MIGPKSPNTPMSILIIPI